MAIQQTTQIPEVKDTIVMLRQLSADEQVHMEAHYREKRLHDEATALGSARREGIAEGEVIGIVKGKTAAYSDVAEKMRQKGYTEEQIKDLLGDDHND